MASCFRSLIVILHFYICHCALLANEPRTTEKNKSTEKDSDLLRQLLNQETLIRMSLARVVQSLLKYQRMAEEGRQATNKTLSDLEASVYRLTVAAGSLEKQIKHMSNEVSDLQRNKQEIERDIVELTNQTSELQTVTLNKVNIFSSNIAGVKNGIKGYADAIVQAACAAVSSEGFISAIRRTCSNDSPSCEQVCMDATSQMKSKVSNQGGKQARCFQAFHFYERGQEPRPGVVGQVNKIMYRYKQNACSMQFCGPNFCCCKV